MGEGGVAGLLTVAEHAENIAAVAIRDGLANGRRDRDGRAVAGVDAAVAYYGGGYLYATKARAGSTAGA